jgi:heme exporter protein C
VQAHASLGRPRLGADLLATAAVLAALSAIFFIAPLERTMGYSQRIMYIHVAVAWVALTMFAVTATAGGVYLLRRNLAADDWLHAAAELGWLSATLTLITGSLWAHAAWHTWWTWDPRLLTTFILWAMYCGLLIVRSGRDDPRRRARLSAVLAIVGFLDVPLVVMATRWFRGIHPVSPGMVPAMRITLLASAAAFTAFFCLLLVRRRWQLRAARVVQRLQDNFGEGA